MKYDYLIVGSGISGCTFANLMSKRGKKCLIIEKQNNIGGNCYTENMLGIPIHKYGAHIFHTDKDYIVDYISRFGTFEEYNHNVISKVDDRFYTLPFNLNTFNEVLGIDNEKDVKEYLNFFKNDNPKNLEEYAISQVGIDIYNLLIKGYTEKQWNCDCRNLPASIIKRIPIRFNTDNSYFKDKYVLMPSKGYTPIFEKMIEDCELRLNTDFFEKRGYWNEIADKIVYTGPIDKFFGYSEGHLNWRSLKWLHCEMAQPIFQSNSVVNYPSKDQPFTRVYEHKLFYKTMFNQNKTVVSFEYPQDYDGTNPMYPIENQDNKDKFLKYWYKRTQYPNTIFLGRLARYSYIDMHQAIDMVFTEIKKYD